MARALYPLGKASARHHYVVGAIWIVLAVAVSLVANSVGRETSGLLDRLARN